MGLVNFKVIPFDYEIVVFIGLMAFVLYFAVKDLNKIHLHVTITQTIWNLFLGVLVFFEGKVISYLQKNILTNVNFTYIRLYTYISLIDECLPFISIPCIGASTSTCVSISTRITVVF